MVDDILKTKQHEAYGMVRIGKINGGDGKFFGSSISPSNHMTIQISRGEKSSEYGRDWFFAKEELIEIKLTPAQFCELMTTNNGSGVPCTIQQFNGRRCESIPNDEPSAAKEAKDYQKKRLEEFAETLHQYSDKVDDILEKKSISKGDKKEIRQQMTMMYQEILSNMPFYTKQFEKAAEKIVTEAKIEVDSFATSVITNLGMEALANGAVPKMIGLSEDD